METVSIIIPCRNEEKYIGKCLDSIVSTSYPIEFLEVIIVDGMSTDRTCEIVEEYTSKFDFIRLIENPKQIVPVAMNLGIEVSKGDTIIRMDAHAVYPQDYISVLVEWKSILKAANIGTVIETNVMNKNLKSNAIQKVLSHKLGVGNGLFRLGVKNPIEVDTVPFGCFEKKILLEVGGYDERLIRNQDIELNKRIKNAGGKVFLIPFSNCTYFARETWGKLFSNNYRNGFWNIKTVYITKQFSSLSLRHFVPLMFLLSLILPLILSMFYFPFVIITLFSLLLYILTLIIVSLRMKRSGTTVIHLMTTFLVLHTAYGLGSLFGLFNIKNLLKK